MYLILILINIHKDQISNERTVKQMYSHILLLAFLVGALQPITPMLEHLFAEGDFVELISMNEVGHKQNCPTATNGKVCEKCDIDESEQQILDMDFYPIPLKIVENTTINGLDIFSVSNGDIDEEVLINYKKRSSPPPREV